MAVALKVFAGIAAPPVGLVASYWANPTMTGAPERSTDFPWLHDATRIDSGLQLSGEDFGVHFFNDAARFNFGPDVQPARDQLPFSVRWQGWLLAPSDGARRFTIGAVGPAQVWIDDAPLGGPDATLNLTAGLHALKVEYARPEARVPSIAVRWQRDPGGALMTLGGDDVRWRAEGASPAASAALGAAANLLIAATVVILIAFGVRRAWHAKEWWWPILAFVPLALAAYGALLEAPSAGKATILSGLDDWLIYESSARDILLNGLLMDGGQGHAPPFYGQPLYPYVLALLHRLTGEALFGPIVVQFAALGLVMIGVAVLARRAFGTAVDGLAALAVFAVFLQLEPEHFKIARQLFNENLYMPLVMASLIALVTLARRRAPPAWWTVALTGGLLGLTAISRSQFLLFIPFGLLILWLAWRRRPVYATTSVVLAAVGLLVVIAPVTARNLVVSGQFVPISSSGGASLLEFHRPPPGLIDQAAIQHDPLYDALHLDQQTRTVVAFARADPGGYIATLLPLGAHSLGLQGRNDPGVYWPLFIAVLMYLASFGLYRTRRLHVWPIHAFVLTHLLLLMLFEADTYGYRLVMPMYAPIIAVAAQLPLAAVHVFMGSRLGAAMRSGNSARSARFATAGWSVVFAAALLWQAKGLVDLWPEREPALHGLGGAAAHAALTSDRVGAGVIYVASVDGTPRRFGAGSLPGLRYPWFKWFDPTRSLPVPPRSLAAVYMLSELSQQRPAGDLAACLGAPDASGEVVADGDRVRAACGVDDTTSARVTFDGLAAVESVTAPDSAAAGDTLDTRLVWQPLVAHPEAQQVSLQLDDPSAGDGTLWGNGTLDLYPARQWQLDETILSRLPVATDPTAIPQPYRLTLGMGPTRSGAQPAMATWQGSRTDRVPVAQVTLTPGSAATLAALPTDMRPLEGPPLVGGGLELIGMRPLPPEAAVGSPLRVGLLWRAVQDQPSAVQMTLRLVGSSGEVLQEAAMPLLGGRATPSSLHEGNVVRDEQKIVISPQAPSDESVRVEVAIADAAQGLGSVKLTGRAHTFDASGAAAEAVFGGAMELLSDSVSRDGANVTVNLHWRAAATMSVGYKVFVHVLDPSGQKVVAQRDAEPQDGKAPTTGWVVHEVLDDAYVVALPSGLAAGAYPVEVGVYDPSTGNRLTLASGDNRLLLTSRVDVGRAQTPASSIIQ